MRLLLVFMLLMVGCASVDDTKPLTLEELLRSVDKKFTFSQAKEAYQRAMRQLDETPDDFSMRLTAYKLAYTINLNEVTNSEDQVNSIAFRDVLALYQQLPETVRSQYNPPSILLAVESKSDTKKYREHLVSAINQNPLIATAYKLMGISFLEQEAPNYDLALVFLLKANQLFPNDSELLSKIGVTYDYKAKANECMYDDMKSLRRVAQFYSQAIKQDPDNAVLHESLSRAFSVLGVYPAALNEIKTSLKLAPNDEWTKHYYSSLQIMTWNDVKQAENELIVSSESNFKVSTEFLYSYYIATRQWENAKKYIKTYIEQESATFYVMLHLSVIMIMTDGIEAAKQNLTDYTRDKAFETAWEQKLYDAFMNSYADRDALVKSAANSCQRAEAYYYPAIIDVIANDLPTAKEGMQNLINERVHAWVENHIAKMYLNHIKQIKP